MSQEQEAIQQKIALLSALGGDAELTAIDLVLTERIRQIQVEGFTPEHDDANRSAGQLSAAGACYGLATHQKALIHSKTGELGLKPSAAHPCWPFGPLAWKPASIRRNSVKGTALMLADLVRLVRGNLE